MVTAGVVLAGGRSTRMGRAKADLPWHGSTLLGRTAAVLARVTDRVLVVRAAGQRLPALDPAVTVHDDPREGRGPLQGIAVALTAAAQQGADVAFVCSTDLPFLHPAFVRAVLGALTDDVDVALPVALGHPQPLAAAYRTVLAAPAEALVAEDRLRPAFLFAQCRVVRLGDEALRADPGVRAHDPDLDSLVNVNEPGEYAAALARPAPLVRVGGQAVRAATVAQALAAAGVAPERRAEVDGRPAGPATPLVTGDVVELRSP